MMKAKIKDKLSKVLSLTLVASMVLSLLLAADIFYPDPDNIAYAAESAAIGTNGHTTGISANGATSIAVNGTYTLGGGAKTNNNGTITVKCLSKNGNVAVMQTYGVTAGSWPGSGDLSSSYSSYWGTLSSAISGVMLPTGSTTSNISPSGSYAILQSAADNYSSFGAANSGAWLGTPYGSGYAYYVYSSGNVYGYDTSDSYVCAPLFNLDLSKVNVSDGVINYATFTESTGIQATQSITSITEGETVNLGDVITAVTYSNGDNAGHTAQYKITVNTGTVDGVNWTAPTGINKPTDVTLTIKDTAVNLTTTKKDNYGKSSLGRKYSCRKVRKLP